MNSAAVDISVHISDPHLGLFPWNKFLAIDFLGFPSPQCLYLLGPASGAFLGPNFASPTVLVKLPKLQAYPHLLVISCETEHTSHLSWPALRGAELIATCNRGDQDQDGFLLSSPSDLYDGDRGPQRTHPYRDLSGNEGRPGRESPQSSNFWPTRSLVRLLSCLTVFLVVVFLPPTLCPPLSPTHEVLLISWYC